MLGVVPDHEIESNPDFRIEPFAQGRKGPGILSYGLEGYGYTCRLGEEIRVVEASSEFDVIDPKRKERPLDTVRLTVHDGPKGRWVLLNPQRFALAHTVEVVGVPADCLGVCSLKSTYLRCGVVMAPPALEPGWNGQVVLELFNASPAPVKLYVGEGIAQVHFIRGEPCRHDYEARGGHYQDQVGLVLPRC
jgi:dCTP deaminase